MKVLVLGASGFLGNIVQAVLSLKFEVYGTTTSSFLRDPSQVNFNYSGKESIQKLLMQINPDCVINCVALADVDKAEANPSLAKFLNFELPRNLSELCQGGGIKLIHISTDHFESPIDGLDEAEDPRPINVYSQTKLDGDLAILENSNSATIIRTNFFGRSHSGDKGLVDFVIKSFQDSQEISGFQNVFFNPVGAHFLATCIQKLVVSDYCGILNISSTRLLSKYEFLCLVAEKLNLDSTRVIPQDYARIAGSASRPKCMSLNPSMLRAFLGVELPSIETQLDMELSGIISLLADKDDK